jgi:hypothetical protein
MRQTTTTLGTEFVQALAAKDERRMRELIQPDIDFRALTPSRFWEARDADTVMSIVLGRWFEESDEIETLEQLETGTVVDRERVGYRFSVRNPDGQFVVEQQAYLYGRDGRIAWMRVLCAGYRPV